MRHTVLLAVCLVFALFMPTAGSAQSTCVTIQDGTLTSTSGVLLETGFDEWGYNYQAHVFNGKYCDAYQDGAWCEPYADDDLVMKWNDAWLSNIDCDGDGELDRHYGFARYIGSGAWATNHQKGTYIDSNGKRQRWEYLVKIVAVPANATLTGGTWHAADGSVIGRMMWGEFAIVQELYNDTGTDDHVVLYRPVHPVLK